MLATMAAPAPRIGSPSSTSDAAGVGTEAAADVAGVAARTTAGAAGALAGGAAGVLGAGIAGAASDGAVTVADAYNSSWKSREHREFRQSPGDRHPAGPDRGPD
jgi:hypothetical protein